MGDEYKNEQPPPRKTRTATLERQALAAEADEARALARGDAAQDTTVKVLLGQLEAEKEEKAAMRDSFAGEKKRTTIYWSAFCALLLMALLGSVGYQVAFTSPDGTSIGVNGK